MMGHLRFGYGSRLRDKGGLMVWITGGKRLYLCFTSYKFGRTYFGWML